MVSLEWNTTVATTRQKSIQLHALSVQLTGGWKGASVGSAGGGCGVDISAAVEGRDAEAEDEGGGVDIAVDLVDSAGDSRGSVAGACGIGVGCGGVCVLSTGGVGILLRAMDAG
jgi:hypothetical protein